MKKLATILFPLVFMVSETLLANSNITSIRDYIKQTYGSNLLITDQQIRQLSWVMDNPFSSPELSHHTTTIHREIPRALSRLYNLQRLRSGTEQDYLKFIAPQQTTGTEVLTHNSFKKLSRGIRTLDEKSYQTLAATALISAVTLSPIAIEKAEQALKHRPPADSSLFLSETAPKADQVYPLAREITRDSHSDNHRFSVAFMPHSHLRHMMYNEGSLAMYQYLKQGLQESSISQQDLDFWYYHWVINIAGFQGHVAPVGSVYLTQPTYNAMSYLKSVLDQLRLHPEINPMELYLDQRAQWLRLNSLTSNKDEQLGVASLAAQLRLFTPQQGKELFAAFKGLQLRDQQRWLDFNHWQLTSTDSPAPTYAPALLANALAESNLADTVQKILPVFLAVIDREHSLRKDGVLPKSVPVSFLELSHHQQIHRLLTQHYTGKIVINPRTGIASLKN